MINEHVSFRDFNQVKANVSSNSSSIQDIQDELSDIDLNVDATFVSTWTDRDCTE